MKQLVVIEIPGLSLDFLPHAPGLSALAQEGLQAPLETIFPALTLPTHGSLMTGKLPGAHGLVSNGWYSREQNQTIFWPQSEGLLSGEKVWESGKKRDSQFKCFKHFMWPGMGSTADVYVNVRPAYHADGRKTPDTYANMPNLNKQLREQYGLFPLFNFWGPNSNIISSSWIAKTAAYIFDKEHPHLSLIYLPHLDYALQRLGPNHINRKK